ncbi:MAG TPA: hypothetical protein VMS17_22655 [Gemmataceae bacterium]|nr:hypothetical protein [Gemmataceae bacterium]
MAMRKLLYGLVGAALLPLPALAKDEPTKVPPGTPVTITVQPAAPSAPPVSFQLDERHGHISPTRTGFTHTGGGYIDIQQPTPDAIVITMTGVAVAGPHPCTGSYAQLCFDLNQVLEVSFDDPKVKAAKVTMDARVIGALRGGGRGTAEESNGCAVISGDGIDTLSVCAPSHSVAGCENLALNDHSGPVSAGIKAGKYSLHGTWTISAAHPRSITPDKTASAEFDPAALDPLWISYWEPYHGIKKADFGLQITLHVADDTANIPAEPVKAPMPPK